MSLLTYKHVQKILILYHGHDINHLKQDTKYGKRIWEWHINHLHPVQILTKMDMDTGMIVSDPANLTTTTRPIAADPDPDTNNHTDLFQHVLFPFHPYLLQHIPQQTILYLNQNDNDNYYNPSNLLLVQENNQVGGEEMFMAGFELYNNFSHYSNNLELDLNQFSRNNQEGNEKIHHDDYVPLSSSPLPPLVGRDEMLLLFDSAGTHDNIQSELHVHQNDTEQFQSSSLSLPTCTTTRTLHHNNNHRDEQQHNSSSLSKIQIMSASGMFLSREYFTLIWHPILDSFRSFVQNKYNQVRTSSTSSTDKSSTRTDTTSSSSSSSIIHQQMHVIQSIAVSTLVTQFSGMSIPLVYPLIRQTWDGQRRNNIPNHKDHDHHHDGGGVNDKKVQLRRLSVEMDGTIGSSIQNSQLYDQSSNKDDYHRHRQRRRRREYWDISTLEVDDNNHYYYYEDRLNAGVGDESYPSLSSSSSSTMQNRRLQQSQQKPTNSQQQGNYHHSPSSKKVYQLSHDDYQFIQSCRRYFGSYTPHTKCWCDGITTVSAKSNNNDVELDCQSKCQVKSDELFISMLPWMKLRKE